MKISKLLNCTSMEEILCECKQLGLKLERIIRINYDCASDECKIILLSEDDCAIFEILVCIDEEDKDGLPINVQVLNINIRP